jgi:hypothetical protein
MVRKLKYHEATLLRKVDFINWKSDQSIRENKVLRRYHVQDREDYHTYNKVCGLITKLVTQLKNLDERDPVRMETTDMLLDKVCGRPTPNAALVAGGCDGRASERVRAQPLSAPRVPPAAVRRSSTGSGSSRTSGCSRATRSPRRRCAGAACRWCSCGSSLPRR